jgi:flagellar biosynthesis protein FlhF
MNIKRYVAGTVQEALQLVKRDMGPEAVILETRTLQGVRGPSQKTGKKVEVTAAIDYDPRTGGAVGAVESDLGAVLERYRALEAEMKEIKDALLSAEAGSLLGADYRFNRRLRSLYLNLRRFGLMPETISRLMEERGEEPGRGKDSAAEILQDSLYRVLGHISVGGRGEDERSRRIVAFVGPTGVGKTTTLAKLAALRAVKQGRKAALITTDTFRVAAASQLETYARIMGIPVETTSGRGELLKALQKHKESDFILIDTAGSSPNRKESILGLAKMLDIPEEVHSYLVLSATTRYQDLLHVDRQFGGLAFSSYIFTKLDETEDPSSMINFLVSSQKPVSYFSTGQQVPEDIEAASKKKVASLLLARMRRGAEKPSDEVSVYGSGESTEGRGQRPQGRRFEPRAAE